MYVIHKENRIISITILDKSCIFIIQSVGRVNIIRVNAIQMEKSFKTM